METRLYFKDTSRLLSLLKAVKQIDSKCLLEIRGSITRIVSYITERTLVKIVKDFTSDIFDVEDGEIPSSLNIQICNIKGVMKFISVTPKFELENMSISIIHNDSVAESFSLITPTVNFKFLCTKTTPIKILDDKTESKIFDIDGQQFSYIPAKRLIKILQYGKLEPSSFARIIQDEDLCFFQGRSFLISIKQYSYNEYKTTDICLSYLKFLDTTKDYKCYINNQSTIFVTDYGRTMIAMGCLPEDNECKLCGYHSFIEKTNCDENKIVSKDFVDFQIKNNNKFLSFLQTDKYLGLKHELVIDNDQIRILFNGGVEQIIIAECSLEKFFKEKTNLLSEPINFRGYQAYKVEDDFRLFTASKNKKHAIFRVYYQLIESGLVMFDHEFVKSS